MPIKPLAPFSTHGGQGGHPSGGMPAVAGGMPLAKKEHWRGGQARGQRRGASQGGRLQAHASPRRPHNTWPGKRLTRHSKTLPAHLARGETDVNRRQPSVSAWHPMGNSYGSIRNATKGTKGTARERSGTISSRSHTEITASRRPHGHVLKLGHDRHVRRLRLERLAERLPKAARYDR